MQWDLIWRIFATSAKLYKFLVNFDGLLDICKILGYF